MIQCPCGSQTEYIACCGLFLDKSQHAPNPEALMRSRYTAFTQARVDYLKQTMRGKPLENFDEVSTALWAKQVKWISLKVIDSYLDDKDENSGYVEFIASYRDQGKKLAIHELSKFQRFEGLWFYTEGRQPKANRNPKISRNAPCYCGSQKKYKNCHGQGK